MKLEFTERNFTVGEIGFTLKDCCHGQHLDEIWVSKDDGEGMQMTREQLEESLLKWFEEVF